jgi:hypothetical protein
LILFFYLLTALAGFIVSFNAWFKCYLGMVSFICQDLVNQRFQTKVLHMMLVLF